MSTSTIIPDLATFGFTLVKRNRIDGRKLEAGKRLDTAKWPPIFIYDALQLPGALTTVLGLQSSLDITSVMTTAKLSGCVLRRKKSTGDLLVEETDNENDSIIGMAVFGRGKTNRRFLGDHYGDGFRRKKVPIEVTLEGGETRNLEAYVWTMKKHIWKLAAKVENDPLWVAQDYVMATGWDNGLAPAPGAGLEDQAAVEGASSASDSIED